VGSRGVTNGKRGAIKELVIRKNEIPDTILDYLKNSRGRA
jgi:hypothetical protein